MSDPNNSGDKAAPSDKTAIISGGVGGAAAGSISGQVGGRSQPADKTMMAVGGKAPAKVEVEIDMLEPAPQSSGASDKTVAPVVARGTKPSNPPPAAPPPAGNGAGGGSGLLQTGPSRQEVSEVTQLFGPGQQPRPGVTINQYELIRELGAGGMGTVYLARDLKLGRKVAIKILQSHHPELTQRFIIEARATARCSHENIVIIYEVGEHGGQPYMVLEFLQGTVLTELVSGGKRLPAARAVELMVPVVKALSVAHEQGIVHRDLKPDNIFVTDLGTVKVLDFGIAKVRDQADKPVGQSAGAIRLPTAAELGPDTGNTNLTRQGVIMGTMKYMSPEQWGIGVEIDHRTDIWATGVILFRLLAGKHPLAPLQGNQLVVTAMLDKPMPKLRDAVNDVPQALCDVVDKCLLKDKELRWKDARELLRALEPFMPGRFQTMNLAFDESPYAGLSSFQESDAARFFGRTREIAAAVNRIRERPVMGVVGPSGVGKSSFVRAGLVPALKQSGESWESLVIRPGRNPLSAVAAMMTPMVGSTSQTVQDDLKEQAAIAARLAREPGHMGQVLRSRAKRSGTKILLFVDQFEELYTLVPDAAERAAFTACLAGAADDASAPVRVVLSLRSDFLDRVGEDPQLMGEVMQGLFFLTPPNRDGLRDALVQPAEMAGYQFENPVMVEEMLSHLETTPGALPLLQFAATKLWENKDSGRKLLTQNAYNAMGGIGGALASHADSVLAELNPTSQALARAVCLRLITPERTRAIVSLAELQELSPQPGDVQRLVDHLVAARLLVSQTAADGSAQGSTVEIVHESLIHSWPALRRWLDETQEDAQFIEQLRVAAKQWHGKGRDRGMLWRGETADEAIRWARRHQGTLPETQRAFLAEVINESTAAERRRRTITIGVVAFLTVLLVAAAMALFTIRQSEKKASKNAIVAKKNASLAEEQAKLAKASEAEAKLALASAEEKERQRLEEEKGRLAAVKEATKAGIQLEMTYEELVGKKAELEVALGESEKAREDAKEAQKDAERNEAVAVQAKRVAEAAEAEATSSKAEIERLLAKEKQRVKELEEQIGQMIETLK
ncbi:MAG TPA: protein kinase [Kofleriaceae bacterium]|nr:protein kinase [Kofleriaceae bacterium]